ncbi:MAG: flavodoxin domain-containing protein [Candidatus Omnitrophota bacterium]
MSRVLVLYYSRTGNTKKMAASIAEGIKSERVEADLKDVKEIGAREFLKYEGIVAGSPTYYGTMAAEIKKIFDDSVDFHGSLDGKVGAAFSSSANVAGGNETTVLDILNAMLIHGMVIQGDPKGDHYGPVAIGAPDNRSSAECMRLGVRVAKLVKKLFS